MRWNYWDSRCFLLCILFGIIVNAAVKDDDIEVVEGSGGKVTIALDEGVIVLNNENFDLVVFAKDIILVEFYAPWCSHCQTLAPEYAKAAQQLRSEDPPIALAKVDATKEDALAAKYEVTGYPTLYIFRKGKKDLYEGPRTAAGIVEYMKQQADPNWKPPPETVLTLTKENFTNVVNKEELILVKFYTPSCNHCKRIAPEYDRAARALRELPNPIAVAKVDATAQRELTEANGVTSFPTLFVFRRGKKFSYDGPRDEAEGIISHMKKLQEPASIEVSASKLALLKHFNKVDATVVGYFENKTQTLFKKYLNAANGYRDKITILHTFNSQIAEEMKEKVGSIVLYQSPFFQSDYEPVSFKYTKPKGNTKEITDFIGNASLPLVGHRKYSTSWRYEKKYPLVVVYYDVDFGFDHRVQTQLIRKEVLKVAKDYQGKITFAISNEDEYNQEIKDLGLEDSGEDVNVGFYGAPNYRYRMEPEEFSSEVLKEFVENVLAGKVPRYLKSLPVPADNKGPLVTVVGDTFEELVMKNSKHVLLEFYAPWCGHCKNLEPTYNKLAKVFADESSVVIAKIDATANDYPDMFKVSGFPTIYFVPGGDKSKAIQYTGDKTLKDLTKFVMEKLKSFAGVAAKKKDEL